jgi:ABC-type transporter Mla subunit MlaD
MSHAAPTPSTAENTAPGWVSLVAGVCILALGVAAYLTLVLTGHTEDTDKLLTFIGPSVAALIIVGYQSRQHAANTGRLDSQDVKLDDIAEHVATAVRQTNGVLDERIRSNATKALEEYDLSADVRQALADMLADRLPEPIPVTIIDEPAPTPA